MARKMFVPRAILAVYGPLAVPNRYVGADFAVSTCPSRFSSTSLEENATICQLVGKFLSG